MQQIYYPENQTLVKYSLLNSNLTIIDIYQIILILNISNSNSFSTTVSIHYPSDYIVGMERLQRVIICI